MLQFLQLSVSIIKSKANETDCLNEAMHSENSYRQERSAVRQEI